MMIKNPTVRKVLNRGYVPITWHTDHGVLSCWVEKIGHKLLHVRLVDGTVRRVSHSEARYMRQITKGGTTTPVNLKALAEALAA